MTIHFAAARTLNSSVLARALARPRLHRPANDNAVAAGSDVLLRAALRHFAEYGLGAAEKARESAEHAFFAGDRDSYTWWLSICRQLDRRMAAAVGARNRRSGHRDR